MSSKPQPSTAYQMTFPSDAVSFDVDKFDEAVRTAGIEMVHYRAMPCPVGMTDPDDNRHPNDHNINCSNGYIYTQAGTVICLFTSNSKDARQTDIGLLEGSTVQVTFPRYYEKSNPGSPDVPVQPCPFDRIFLKDDVAPVPTWERFACSAGGTDRLRYPALSVVDLMDSRGNRYIQGTDFNVVNGRIAWKQTPGIDPKTQLGIVCSVRYTYKPFWYVQRMVHEVRVAQVEDPSSGDRKAARLPQSMVLQREKVFENEQYDPKKPDAARSIPLPDTGSIFGSR